jgi:glycosyltransferase involved in cell wall biosynthesis
VLFYGQFIPLHGVPTIIEAARRLRQQPVDWLLIGRGQESPRICQMLDADPLPRLRWIEWVDYATLVEHIRAADVCLGIFGTSEKAASVIPNKVYQVLASGKPVITRDSAAIRELLDPCTWADALVPAGDPGALAEAVLRRADGASNASQAPLPRFDAEAIGTQLIALLTQNAKDTEGAS